MNVRTILTICVIGFLVTAAALYDAVTGDVSEWIDGLRTDSCECHCLPRVFED